jgi:tetratricopeptide (TPR) repeat protein
MWAIAVIALAPAAFAQGLDREWQHCEDSDGQVAIDACSAIILSGRETPRKVAAALNNRGALYGERGDLDRALQDFDQSISLDPNQPSAFFNRGRVYEDKKQYARAVQDYDRAIALDPSDASIRKAREAAARQAASGSANPGTAALPNAPKGYVGCLAENSTVDLTGLQGRALAGHCITSSSQYAGKCALSAPMTVDRCVSECATRGFQFAGVQYRDWCFCGNDIAPAKTSTACTMPCAGNASQTCGGSSANSVYSTRR